MQLHEYQAKELLSQHGIAHPLGRMVTSPEAALEAAAALGGERWLVKAQIHAGGRGKAGGVWLCNDSTQLADAVAQLLGQRLVTAQTGGAGLVVERLLIESPITIRQELYLALLVDRATERVRVLASAVGGMDIETLAHAHPEQLVQTTIHPTTGLKPWHSRRIGFALGLSGAALQALPPLLAALYQLLLTHDAQLVEINPLALTPEGSLVALDAKIEIDDNALYRQSTLASWRDPAQEDPREQAARTYDLNYIHLDGTIGCMVNGAGLAMATMDLVEQHGGRPANFLDVGGGTTAERVAEAFKLIISDTKVAAVLVNIFGGIVRCDLIAEGIIQAVREVQLHVPLVVRLAGNHAEQGLERLAASGLALTTASDLDTAAATVVAAARRKETQ